MALLASLARVVVLIVIVARAALLGNQESMAQTKGGGALYHLSLAQMVLGQEKDGGMAHLVKLIRSLIGMDIGM